MRMLDLCGFLLVAAVAAAHGLDDLAHLKERGYVYGFLQVAVVVACLSAAHLKERGYVCGFLQVAVHAC